MSTMADAKFFLKKCYEHQLNTKNFYMDTTYVVLNYKYSSQRACQLIDYAISKGYATKFVSTKDHDYPEGIKITARGVDWIEDVKQETPLVQNITFQNNYGSVGNGNTITVNNSFSLKQFDDAVAENLPPGSPYTEEIQKLRAELERIQESNEPVPPGKLNSFAKLLQDNAWLTGPVATILLELFVHHQGLLP